MTILLDNGHGSRDITKGKYSPVLDSDEFNIYDETVYKSRFREGIFNRIIVKKLYEKLNNAGYEAKIIVPEDDDVSLGERVRRANAEFAKNKCVFVSIHANAAGNGTSWSNARGLSVHVANHCSEMSVRLARNILDAGHRAGFAGNRSVPSERVWRNDFYVVKNTLMPAVLVENLFYDNKDDLKILMSEDGRERIVNYLYVGICNTVM